MKKIVLFVSACIIGLPLFAQENKQNIAPTHQVQTFNSRQLTPLGNNYKKGLTPKSNHQANVAGKITSTPSGRWMNYGKYMDTAMSLIASTTDLAQLIIWNDTSGVINYTTGPAHNTMVSCGAILHPQAYCFNDTNFYTGELGISPSDAYIVDSINLVGLYYYNPAKTAVVDTLTISFVFGDPFTSGTDIGLKTYSDPTRLGNHGLLPGDVIRAGILPYDSVTNTVSGTSSYTMKYYLSMANWGDTLPNGIWSKAIMVPGLSGTGFNVPAGNMLGYTVSFKSGDPTFAADSVIGGNIVAGAIFQYNLFQPIYEHIGTNVVPLYSVYDSMDFNSGQFKYLPNCSNGLGNLYAPMFEFDSVTSTLPWQNSYNDIHIKCATCTVLARHGGVNVTDVNLFSYLTSYPNPASENVSIKFGLNKPMDVSVSILNLLGQVVAIKDLKNTGGETITFSTEKLPSGMYYYILTTDGVSKTGKIDILH